MASFGGPIGRSTPLSSVAQEIERLLASYDWARLPSRPRRPFRPWGHGRDPASARPCSAACNRRAILVTIPVKKATENRPMAFVFALILIVVLLACWILTVLGLPGNWLMAAATAIYAWLTPAGHAAALGWRTVMTVAVLAVLGEIIELAAGALGVARTGGSRRNAVLALAGSLVGSVLGVVVGVPIPVAGSLIAAVLFAGMGAMAGAILGELSVGRTPGLAGRSGKRPSGDGWRARWARCWWAQ